MDTFERDLLDTPIVYKAREYRNTAQAFLIECLDMYGFDCVYTVAFCTGQMVVTITVSDGASGFRKVCTRSVCRK